MWAISRLAAKDSRFAPDLTLQMYQNIRKYRELLDI